MIRCDSGSHANQTEVIHVEGPTFWKKLPEMFLCFDESWYQPPLNLFSSANLALRCKINFKVGGVGEVRAAAWINSLWFDLASSLFSTQTVLFDDTGSPFIGDVKYQYEVGSTVMAPRGGRRFSEWRHNKLPAIKGSGSCSLLLTNASLLLSELS